jgi:hypothetical protein
MGVGIDEPWQDNFAGAVDFANFLSMTLDPGIAQRVFGSTDGNNLAPEAPLRLPRCPIRAVPNHGVGRNYQKANAA